MNRDLVEMMGGEPPERETAREISGDTYTLVLHRDEESDLSILVSESGDAKRACWLPRSRISYHSTGTFHDPGAAKPKLPIIEATVPEWLATKEGLA